MKDVRLTVSADDYIMAMVVAPISYQPTSSKYLYSLYICKIAFSCFGSLFTCNEFFIRSLIPSVSIRASVSLAKSKGD